MCTRMVSESGKQRHGGVLGAICVYNMFVSFVILGSVIYWYTVIYSLVVGPVANVLPVLYAICYIAMMLRSAML